VTLGDIKKTKKPLKGNHLIQKPIDGQELLTRITYES
jgi:hypothetical protein